MAEEYLVLIVDDDPSLSRIMQQSIDRMEGVRAMSATNGTDAVQLAVAEPPNLIFMDIDLGHDNGYDTWQAILDQGVSAGTCVWFITGRTANLQPGRAESLGARGARMKPFGLADLREMVNAATAEHGSNEGA